MEVHRYNAGRLSFQASVWPVERTRPTLVMLHGSGGSSVLWEHQLSGLAKDANTVALDFPGHGESVGPHLTSVEAVSDAVADFLEDQVGAPVVICGLSMGGAVALQLMLDHPEQVAAGVLMSTGARLRVAPAIFAGIANNYPAFVRGMPVGAASRHTPAPRLQSLLDAMLANGPAPCEADFRMCDRFDVMPRLAEIRQPVLVVSGEDDRLTPPKYGAYLEARLPHAERVLVARAGHLAPLEQPAVVNAAMARFLRQTVALRP